MSSMYCPSIDLTQMWETNQPKSADGQLASCCNAINIAQTALGEMRFSVPNPEPLIN